MQTKNLHDKERMHTVFALRFFGDPAIQAQEITVETLDYFCEKAIIRALERMRRSYFVNDCAKEEALAIIKTLKETDETS